MKTKLTFILAIAFLAINSYSYAQPVANMDERIANIEGTVSQMNERLNHLGDEIIGIRSEMKAMETSLRGEILELRSDMKSNFKWTLAIILGSWITMIGTFIGFFIALLGKLPK